MRMRYSVHGVALVLWVILFTMINPTPSLTPDTLLLDENEAIILNCVSENTNDVNLTWTSRTQSEPQLLENGSIAAGDHVVVNASFPESFNITRCEMRIWNGFTFTTTRPLVNATDPGGVFTGIIDPAQFDWVVIKGIEKGLRVNITCNFTNRDSDFMAWDGTINQSLYTYSNNIVEMTSGDKPEHHSFTWTSDNDTLVLGCLNYAGGIGNWTLLVQVGIDVSYSCTGSSISMDTYYFERVNQTCNILVTGIIVLSESFSLLRERVRICNFFAPNVTIHPIETLPSDDRTYNITWSSTDANADDVHYYTVWLSNNDGLSFMLMAQNLTRTWHLWNSSGWLEDDYMVRVRAYSVDFTVPGLADVSDPPEGYWPGDYHDAFTPPFPAGNVGHGLPPPYFTLDIDIVTNSSYVFGSTGNTITVHLTFTYHVPTSIPYVVSDNGSFWLQGDYRPRSFSETFTINIDGLSIGYHIISVGVTGYYTTSYQSLAINVTEQISSTTYSKPLDWNPFVQALAIGISIGSVTIIITVLILTIRLKRNRIVEYI